MQVCDFRNSFLFFEVDHERAITVTTRQPIPHNQVRISLECRCEVTAPAGHRTSYVLSASCKTERVAVDSDIWQLPNADFCVVYSPEDFLILKRWQQCGLEIAQQSEQMARHVERQVGKSDDAWSAHRVDLDLVAGREITGDDIVAAVLENRTLVSHTEYQLEDGSKILVEYPVKTINVSDRFGNYQVDTGPILFPDMRMDVESFIGTFRLAYVAHHQPDWAEFILNVPTAINGDTSVHHYSEPARLDVSNSMYVLP